MKLKIFKLMVITLLIPISLLASIFPFKHNETKTINKEFLVNQDNLLYISNRFGNVDITTWNENKIVFTIKITVQGNDSDEVMEKLDDITIEFNQSANEVRAKTHISSSKSKSWYSWIFNHNNDVNYKINYTVKMPINNDLTIYNDYGSIYLNEINGKTNINCDYGKLVLGSLNNIDNEINTDYSKNSTIEYIKQGKINADYSSISIDASKKIVLNADYTNSTFINIEELQYDCDYGKLTVENANIINGNGDYLSMRFGNIYKNLKIDADYGSLRIDTLKKGFETVTIESDYTGVRLGIENMVNCNIQIDISYGGINYDDGFVFPIKHSKTTSKHYEGYFNQKNENSSIEIEMDFGSLKLVKK